MIAAIIFILFIAFAWAVPKKYRPYVIYAVTLGLIYAVTLQGDGVVGSDVSGELQATNYVLAHQGIWDLTIQNANNTSYVVSWLVPFISTIGYTFASIFHNLKPFYIEPELVYKWILPLFLAGVPVVLYIMWKGLFGEMKALYAVMFFIAVPVMQMEIVAIGKSMVAELFMVLTLWVMLSDMKIKWKVTGMLGFGILTLFAHYSVGILLCIYIAAIGGWTVVRSWKVEWRKGIGYIAVGVILAISILGYYSYTGGGYIGRMVFNIGGDLIRVVQVKAGEVLTSGSENSTVVAAVEQPVYLSYQQPLTKAALGLDFFNASWLGKVFRVLQYMTQALVILGCWMILKSKVKREYKAGIVVSFGFLVCCMFVPIFSSILNVSRFYHIALMWIAPGLVVGTEQIWKWIEAWRMKRV